MNYKDIPKDFLIQEYKDKHRSAKEISEELYCGETTIFRALEHYNIKRRSSKENQNPLYGKEPSREELFNLHINSHISINSIAKMFKTSWGNIKRLFDQYKIKTKSHDEIIRKKGFIKPSKEEIISLLEEGNNTETIAKRYDVNRTTIVSWINNYRIPINKIKRKTNPYNKVWDEEKIILKIKEIYKGNQDLSVKNCRKIYPSLYNAGVNYFGSWAKAINSSDINYYGKIAINKNKYWTKELIKERIINIYKSDKRLSSKYVRNNYSDVYDAAKIRFGSWEKAINYAGLNYQEIALLKSQTKEYKTKLKDKLSDEKLKELVLLNRLTQL